MPTRIKIQEEIESARQRAHDTVRRRYLKELHEKTGRAVILYAADGSSGHSKAPPQVLSITTGDVQGFMGAVNGIKEKQLDLILHSAGGSLDAAEQIVNYLRAKFCHIRAIVPQAAMSAATMLACACDEIVMGKQSALGPIDPQITLGNAPQLPAQAYLDEFDEAKRAIAEDPTSANVWVPKLKTLPHGILTHCKTTIDLSRSKVAYWLNEYMLKDQAKSDAIAAWLGDAKEHKTHGRPISAALAKSKGLKIVDLEADQSFQDLVLSAYHATMITFEQTGCVKIFENHLGHGMYAAVKVSG